MNDKIKAIAWLTISIIGLPLYIATAWLNTFHLPNQFQIAYLVPIIFYFAILFGFVQAWWWTKSEEEKKVISLADEKSRSDK